MYISRITSPSGYLGGFIDVWKAYRDGLWTSSVAISVYADGARNPSLGDSTKTFLSVGRTFGAGFFTEEFYTEKPYTVLNPTCEVDPAVLFTATMYDDGTYSLA